MELEYTHNLKIILLDDNKNIVGDENILSEIKNILSENNTHKIEWNGKVENFTIKWDKIILSEINQILMGDLFSQPIYDFDRIILNHTQQTLSKISTKCKYTIKFYLSRIIMDKKISKDSCGLV
jgi:hypothetical protein